MAAVRLKRMVSMISLTIFVSSISPVRTIIQAIISVKDSCGLFLITAISCHMACRNLNDFFVSWMLSFCGASRIAGLGKARIYFSINLLASL